MEKVDLKKTHRTLYGPKAGLISEVVVPAFRFLMVDGQGDPGKAKSYRDAVEALFSLSYTIKFMVKKWPEALDYAVMPLEGLWWADDLNDFVKGCRDRWKWTMMIHQPPFITEAMVKQAAKTLAGKKELPSLAQVRFEPFEEGFCAQTLHVGPFSAEGPTIEKLHGFIEERGGLRGKHHEIYLSDIRKADPKKWKTVLRQPMGQTLGMGLKAKG